MASNAEHQRAWRERRKAETAALRQLAGASRAALRKERPEGTLTELWERVRAAEAELQGRLTDFSLAVWEARKERSAEQIAEELDAPRWLASISIECWAELGELIELKAELGKEDGVWTCLVDQLAENEHGLAELELPSARDR